MRKTEQTVTETYIVEGPNEDGKYRVTHPYGYTTPFAHHLFYEGVLAQVVQTHRASAPKLVEIDGYLVGTHECYPNGINVWSKHDRVHAERRQGGLVHADTVADAWKKIARYSAEPSDRQFVRPLLAIIRYFEEEEDAK